MTNYRVVKEVFRLRLLSGDSRRVGRRAMMIVDAITMASDSRICCVIIKLKLIMQFKLNLYFFSHFCSVVNKIL